MPKPFLVADWTIASGSGPDVVELKQDADEYCKLGPYQDCAFLIDCSDVSAPSGTSITLQMETSPTFDESMFQNVSAPITLVASSTVVRSRTLRIPSTQPLAQYLRHKVYVPGGTSGNWRARFRIRAIPVKSRFFVPPDVENCVLWLRADLGITLVSGAVSQWDDQSGQSHNATQSTAGLRPTQSLADASYNGGATLAFPTDKGMSISGFAGPEDGTLFIVGNGDGAASNRTFIDAVSPAMYLFRATSGTAVQFTRDGTSLLNATASTTGSPHVYVIDVEASTSRIYQDSVTALATGDPGAGAADEITIGFDGSGANWLSGKIAEIIFYEGPSLAQKDRTRVMRYLGSRYGIRITP